MRLQQEEAARKAAEEAKKPAQVDEASLAEKIREMLSADMRKQSERMLEQHTEELQLSLLSKLKFVATQAQEAEAAAAAAATAEQEAKVKGASAKAKSGKGRGKKGRKGRKGGKKRRPKGDRPDERDAPSLSPTSRGSKIRALPRGRSRRRRRRHGDPRSQSPSSRSQSPLSSHEDGGSFRDGDESSAKTDTASVSASAGEGKFPGVSRPTYCLPWRDQPGSGSRRRLSETNRGVMQEKGWQSSAK